MTRDAQIKQAERLRAKGLLHREIAEQLGVQTSTVWGWLNPEANKEKIRRSNAKRSPAKRQHADLKRRNCPQCGEKMGTGTGYPGRTEKNCKKCQVTNENAQTKARYEAIQRLWSAGWSLKEIASKLDSTVASISVSMVRMRKEGWNLPYRYRRPPK